MPENKRICKHPPCKVDVTVSKNDFCLRHIDMEDQIRERKETDKVKKRKRAREEKKLDISSHIYKEFTSQLRKIPFMDSSDFWWPVEKYYIKKIKKKSEKKHVIDTVYPMHGALEIKWYEPLKERNLALNFANTDVFCEDYESEILSFVNKYGLLRQNYERPSAGGEEDLDFFKSEIKNVRHLIYLYMEIFKGQKALKESIKVYVFEETMRDWPWHRPGEEKNHIGYEAFAGGISTDGFILNESFGGPKKYERLAKVIISDGIFKGMKKHGVFPSVQLNKKNIAYPTYSLSNLIGAIYFQLYNALTKSWAYKQCIVCGDPFFYHRSDNQFCGDRCRSRYTTRQSRLKTKSGK